MAMIPIRCTILRGGTSKGIYLLENDLPESPELRDKVILAIFGSPDKRQIDGLGGADPLTSKVAIVGASKRPGIDFEYTFGQVDITNPKIFYKSLCGNISSGVPVFAINHGLVKAVSPVTTVKYYNTNTGKVLIAEVPVEDGKAAVEGDYSIAGVPGTGAKINLDFSQTKGALTGRLLPTGNVKDEIEVNGIGKIVVSIVDTATCQVFIRAEDVGLKGIEKPSDVDSNPELLARLEAIRCKGAAIAGLASSPEAAAIEAKNTPHLVMVSEAKDYVSHLSQKTITAKEVSFVARMMFMQIMHKTYAGTGSICTAVAAKIPGTIANEVLKNVPEEDFVRIGHPAGIIKVEVKVEQKEGEFIVERAAIGRTARQIMTGYVYIRDPERTWQVKS